MKALQTVLLYYSFLIAIFITLGAAAASSNLVFFIISLPTVVYFILTIFKIKFGRKLFLYYSFILATIMAIMGFIGASSIPHIISAALFLPMAIYFWLIVLPKRNKKLLIPAVPVSEKKLMKGKIKKIEGEVLKPHEFNKNYDLDRRKFIKLIGSAGVTLFMFSLFTKKAEAAFFGSVPGPGTVALKGATGSPVDPAIKHPTDGYKISQLDDSTPAYYGFLEKTGKWFIMREESSGDYRYTKGDTNFATNWTNRAGLTYNYYDAIF